MVNERPNSPLKKSIRSAVGSCDRITALRSLPESPDSTRSRALSSVTIARPRLQSDFINGLLNYDVDGTTCLRQLQGISAECPWLSWRVRRMMGRAPGPRCLSPISLIFISLRPFSFSPKEKGQKERRRSDATGLLFREYRPKPEHETLPCIRFSADVAIVGNGTARKSPRTPDRPVAPTKPGIHELTSPGRIAYRFICIPWSRRGGRAPCAASEALPYPQARLRSLRCRGPDGL